MFKKSGNAEVTGDPIEVKETEKSDKKDEDKTRNLKKEKKEDDKK